MEVVSEATGAHLAGRRRSGQEPGASGVAAGTLTILVAGVVRRLDRLRRLGEVRRASWATLVAESARGNVGLAIVGASPSQVDARGLIAALKRGAATGGLPVLHLGSSPLPCVACGAEVCLPSETSPETLLGVARVLLSLHQAQRELLRAEAPWPAEQDACPVPGEGKDVAGGFAGRTAGERVLHKMVELVPGIVYVYDLEEGRYLPLGEQAQSLLGYSRQEVEAMGPPLWTGLIHPDDLNRVNEARAASGSADDGQTYELECRVKAASGEWHTLRSREVVLARSQGRVRQILGVATDVTEHREALRRLQRSQRLEALGRMTGEIAHDFNNILGVITGQGQLTLRLLPRDHPACAGLDQVVKASERAAALTRQLLAFSKGPSHEPRSLDLNAVISNLTQMLQRAVSEDVELQIDLASGLGVVRADATQMEQVLLNLAVNARDAMPSGGRLRIETCNVELSEGEAGWPGGSSGRFVLLVVSDDGTGMDAETRRRMFEPFFTTKPEGVGSGLGLATVHDVVSQCGGSIRVDSAPGRGTTFRIYLPRVDPPDAVAPAETTPQGEPGGRETVLLVEDAEPVRQVTRELLEGLGYTVLTASHGVEALALAQAHAGPIHVLLTDVVMPRLGGEPLAVRLAQARPGIRVLYMSGYPGGAQPGRDGLAAGMALLAKPFTRDRLAHAIREVLERPLPG